MENLSDSITDFRAYWPKLLNTIQNELCFFNLKKPTEWLTKVLEENVPNGKQFRALVFLDFYQKLNPAPGKGVQQTELAYVVAWCIEIMQAAYLMADDIMDGSSTRRGRPCWYTLERVGITAINDALLLENLVYQLLSLYFKHWPGKLLELIQSFQKSSFITIMGQGLDTQFEMASFLDVEHFTENNYRSIVQSKTSYYTFFQPIHAAIVLAHDSTLAGTFNFSSIEKLCFQIGYLFQVQDDFIDCFVDPSISQKIGTDIQKGKCTWFAVQCVQKLDSEEIKTFKNAYGKDDQVSVEKIKSLYDRLRLPEQYTKLEHTCYENILNSIQNLDNGIPAEPLIKIVNSILKRMK